MSMHCLRTLFIVCAPIGAALLISCGKATRQETKNDTERVVEQVFRQGFAEEARALRASLEAHDAGPPPSFEGMVLVPEGESWSGCDRDADPNCRKSEAPYERAYLPSFYIDRTEVTVAAYKECVDAGACTEPTVADEWGCDATGWNWGQPGRDRHPINCVHWGQANSFCRFRNKRLPTSAEWEKAARGTDGRIYPWGNEPPTCEVAVAADEGLSRARCDGGKGTAEVGSRPKGASPYGVLDMAGNVEEWTTRDGSAPVNTLVEGTYYYRHYQIKGGHYASVPQELRASVVRWSTPATDPPTKADVATTRGFRCAYSEHTRPSFEPGTWLPDVEAEHVR